MPFSLIGGWKPSTLELEHAHLRCKCSYSISSFNKECSPTRLAGLHSPGSAPLGAGGGRLAFDSALAPKKTGQRQPRRNGVATDTLYRPVSPAFIRQGLPLWVLAAVGSRSIRPSHQKNRTKATALNGVATDTLYRPVLAGLHPPGSAPLGAGGGRLAFDSSISMPK